MQSAKGDKITIAIKMPQIYLSVVLYCTCLWHTGSWMCDATYHINQLLYCFPLASGKAAGPSGTCIVAEMLMPLGKLVQLRYVISLRTSSRRDAFQLTGRKASLSICTRAKGMLWIEATTGAWSWLSKWWRCWSVWWRDSSGKELRSMRCSVASCLAVALLMQFLLYVSYRRSTWLPTSRSTWPSSIWRKHLIEFHGMSSGGQWAN